MKVEFLNPNAYEEYENFLLKQPSSLLYHSISYKNFLIQLLQCQDEYLLARDSNGICGILPLMKKNGKWGWVYNSLPYYGSNGGVIAKNQEASDALFFTYNQLTSQVNVASSTLVTNPLQTRDYSALKCNCQDQRISQMTEIGISNNFEEEILQRIESSARRNVQKAIREGISVEIDDQQLGFLKNTHKENMQVMNGKAKSDLFFSLVQSCFQFGKDYLLYVAKKEGKLVAALLLFFYNSTVEYFTPVVKEESRIDQPLSLILFEAMKDSAKRGFLHWNWGGTWLTQNGVYQFKKKWGAKEITYFYHVMVNREELYTSSVSEISEEYPNFFVIPFNNRKS